MAHTKLSDESVINFPAEDRIVSLEDYVEAYTIYKNFLSEVAANGDKGKEDSDEKKKFNQIRDLFTRENGQIINRYICGYSNSAVMICQKRGKGFFERDSIRFFSQYELGVSPEIESLLIEIDFLAAESTRLLRGKSLNRCLGLIYKVAKNTLILLDSMNESHGKPRIYAGNTATLDILGGDIEGMPRLRPRSVSEVERDIEKTIAVVEKNLENARSYHDRAAKLTAQMDYFLGNILGFVGIIAILAILALINGFSFFEIPGFQSEEQAVGWDVSTLLYFGITAGCIGAIISVMNRISSGNLQLNHEPDSQTIRIIGLIRPFIGGVFGGLLLILLNSGLSIFDITGTEPNKAISNFIILGFIAGFFERFVPDILDKTKGKVAAGDAPGTEGNPEPAGT
jgi:hypothetical protein